MTAKTAPDIAHPIGLDGIVSIRLRDGDVRLRAVDGEVVRIRDRHDRDLGALFSVELGDGSASLLDSHGPADSSRSHQGRSADLDVELPRRATIVLETVSADVDVDGLMGDQRYQTTSGDLTLRAVSGRLTVEAVSADIDIRATGETDVAARTVSGDIELRAGTLRSLRLATTSGDIKVAGRLDGSGPFAVETVSGDAQIAPAGNVRIEMATMSGDLHSELDGRTEGSRGRRTLVIGSDGPVVTFRSMSGDLSVVRPVAVLERDRNASAPVEPVSPPAPLAPPSPIDPPAPPDAPDAGPTQPPRNGAIAAAYEDARLGILRALERGDIDVAEAGRRFEALDGGESPDAEPSPGDPSIDPASDTTRVPIVDRDDA